MKKNFKYALLSAIALVGAVSFSACSSSDEIVDNPDYNPADNTVTTQFTFSLSKGGANKVSTRQTAEIVQDNLSGHTGFRGMTKMSLIPFGGEIAANSSPLGQLIGPLTMVSTATTPSSTASFYNNTDNDAVVYTNIPVPNSTSHFLFYGQATDATGTGLDNHDNGTLAVTGLYGDTEGTYSFTHPNNITFAPVPIYDAAKTTEIGVGTSLVSLLNSLLTVTDGETTPKKWSEYTAADNALLNGLYTNYIKLTTASSYSVAAMLVDLYESLEGLANTAAGTVGKNMATNLRTAIAAGFTSGTIAAANIIAAGYPGNLGLPDGAAKLAFDATTGFSLVADPNAGNFPTGVSITNYNDYVYPANLQYFVNSPIKVSNTQQSPNFPGKVSWTACTDLYKNGTIVTPMTKSIALTNEIQYGVGNLKTVVNALTSGTYYDRNAEPIDITTNTTPFTLTGVLVGSQGQVEWNFVPATQGSKTIYDNEINLAPLSTSASANNFTLGLETVEVPATPDGTTGVVYIALELRNDTGKDFMGKDGLIPAGGKFYLAGKLDPSVTSTINANTDNIKSVFKQDYLTTANLTIAFGTPSDSDGDGNTDTATGGFAEATNGIPDLRTPQSEVCFSVNLQWKSGIVFDINL